MDNVRQRLKMLFRSSAFWNPQMIWRRIVIGCHQYLHELILILVGLLTFVVVWPVGEYPILDDWAFVKSLEHLHNDGELVVLDWNPMSLTGHLLWGLIFTKCFGFSFLVTKISAFVAGLLVTIFVYQLSKRYGAHPHFALIAGLALLLNPLFLAHCFMYMTDVTGLMWQWASLACLTAGVTAQKRNRYLLFGMSSFFWAMAFLTRQHGITVPLALAAYIILCDRSLFQLSCVVPAFLPGTVTAMLGLAWHKMKQGTNQSYETSSELVLQFIRNPPWFDLPYIGWSYAVYAGLFAAPVILAVRWNNAWRFSSWRLLFVVLAAWNGILLFVDYSMQGLYFPHIRNVVTQWGMFSPGEFVTGDRELLWDREWGIAVGLLGILSAIGWLVLIVGRPSDGTDNKQAPQSPPPLCATRLFLLLLFFQVGYVCATTPILYDRHLLLVAPTLIVISALAASQLAPPRLFAPGILLLLYGIYGTACIHDLHAVSRAVFVEGKRLLAQGIDAKHVDAGYAFDGWYMYERSRMISRSTSVRLPPWWPVTVSTETEDFQQPWWVYHLATEVRPRFVVATSTPINGRLFAGQYLFEEMERGQPFRRYWPWRQQRVFVFRCQK